ncbi:MAG: hypothetical protein ACXV95_12205 [Acidimicrobiales bacterium]
MNQATRKMLKSSERQLLRETEPAKLRKRDEDELVDLHRRVRRARTKYAKLYRRRASAQVKAHGTRAMASKANKRTSVKAEVFEDALARVSRRLAKRASARADELREERLRAARATKGGRDGRGGSKKRSTSGSKGSGKQEREKKQLRTPEHKRAAASSRAATRRKQAARAGR